MQRYNHILTADDHYSSWQEVITLFFFIGIGKVKCFQKKKKMKYLLEFLFSFLNVFLIIVTFYFALCFYWSCQVEEECKEDPEGLALRLAGKGAVSAALEVAESAGLSTDLRRELKGRQLVKLLTADPLNGGGPAEASRFLSSLRDSDDALPVAMGAMQLLPNLRSKQLLVINCF